MVHEGSKFSKRHNNIQFSVQFNGISTPSRPSRHARILSQFHGPKTTRFVKIHLVWPILWSISYGPYDMVHMQHMINWYILGFPQMGPPGMLPPMHPASGMPPMSRDNPMAPGMAFLSGAGGASTHPSMLGGGPGFHPGSLHQPPYHHSLPTSVPDLSSAGVLSIGNSCWLPNPHDDANLWF